MLDFYSLYYLALAATIVTSLAMATLLWVKAYRASGAGPLIIFCCGVAIWAAGHLLINLGEAFWLETGRFMVNLSPLAAAAFLHFSVTFTGKEFNKAVLLYLSVGAISILAIVSGAGEPAPWIGFKLFYGHDSYAVAVAGITVSFGLAGHIYLLPTCLKAELRIRRQAMAVFIAGAWGLISASGFLAALFGLDIFPFTVIFMPGYTLIMVYGILRYELMEINLWARKSLEWTIIIGAILIAISLAVSLFVRLGLSQTPIWQVWPVTLAAILITILIHRPATELATRLVYPGSWVDSSLLEQWRAALDRASSWDELTSTASALISKHLGHTVEVTVAPILNPLSLPFTKGENDANACPPLKKRDGGGFEISSTIQFIHCYKTDSHWTHSLTGWDNAAPGVLRTAEVFSAILVSGAGRLEQALKIAQREKEMLKESHLAELGRLSAAVAHEMRNPLNIISMASASCDSETKKEIAGQLDRAGRLINDLLAYSGKMQIELKRVNLREELDFVLSHYPGKTIQVDVSPEISIQADSHRLHQVFYNLLDNSFAALKEREDGRILIRAEQESNEVRIPLCDNGPGIPENLRGEIFQPFISGRTGGTGLGLAIVRRIMEAHGGRIELGIKEGWGCCFEMRFPREAL